MASRQGQSGSGSEQRRFARVPINLDGLLSIGGQPAFPCTARDFCAGGMFISADPAAYAKVEPQTPAVLYFALFIGGEKQDFQVGLTIARAVAKGLGVSFRDPDPKALGFLQQLAAPAAAQQIPDSGEALTETQQGFAPEFSQTVGPLKELVGEQTRKICGRFLERVDEVLFLAARDAGNNLDETRYLDGQREVRGRKERLLERVPPQIDLGLSVIGNPLGDQDDAAESPGLSDLSLVEKDEFEDFLAVSEMVSELEPEFSEPLFALAQRFTYLANRDVDTSAIPIGPSVFCNAIADVLKGMQSDTRVTKRVYQVLHEVMSGNLGELYKDVNALLVEHGVVPVIEKDKPVIKKTPNSTGGFDAPVDDALDSTIGTPEDELVDMMPSPENYHGRGQVPAGGVRSAPRGAPAAYPQGGSYHGGGAPSPQHVQPAPPAVPWGVTAPGAPPTIPAGVGVQASAPSVSAGPGIQGAPPTVAAGAGVQAAAPPNPAGAGVQAAAPTAPADAGIQAAPPSAPAGVQAAGAEGIQGAPVSAGFAGGGQLPAGWVSPGVQYAPPSMRQAVSTAQAQMALREQIGPPAHAGISETVQQRGAYSHAQVLDGLSEIQESFANTASPELLDVDEIKKRITSALIGDGSPERMIGDESNLAIEIVANLFSSLLQDALVPKGAKSHLTRLQPSVHKAALMDSQFFESEDHPVRQVINRIAQVRDGKGAAVEKRHARVQELVAQANQQFQEDVSVFDPIVSELDEILDQQHSEYEQNVGAVVASCDDQQRVIEQRRDQSLESTDAALERSDFPEEWSKWLERARKLEMGERVLMNANSTNSEVVTLVWKEIRNTLFVFADDLGNKASTLTLEQVAMYLRRGVIAHLERDQDKPAMDRAMFGVVDRFHSQVEDHATRDALTGYLTRKYFTEAIDEELPDADSSATRNAVLAVVSVENVKDVNQQFGDDAGDALLKEVATMLKSLIKGRDVEFGRLGGIELGVYWPAGGIQTIYKRLQSHLTKLGAISVRLDNDTGLDGEATADAEAATIVRAVSPEIVIGVTGSEDGLVQAEGLLAAAAEACGTAREMGTGSIYVAGSESEQRRQMEQMVAYANKAIERDCLLLFSQHVTSLLDGDLPPAMHVAVGAKDRSDKPIPSQIFTPALARSEIAADIDMWTFRQTLAWMVEHEDEVENYAVVVIPLSSASIRNEDLPNMIMTEFMETPVPPGKICFELPDRDVVESAVEAGELINTLKEFGCRFVLDEFGSGHDNYDYVKDLDVDYVTVKTGFITDAANSPKDFAMAKSINELVHFMGKKTIAKQAKGHELAEMMREIGIDFMYDLAERAQITP